MKFLCPQCKAKYKIADEKIANRATPRMKCRKCGHVIDIRSAAPADDRDSLEPPPPPRPRTGVANRPSRTGGIPRPPSARSSPMAAAKSRPVAPSPVAPSVAQVARQSPAASAVAPAHAASAAESVFEEDAPTVIKDIATLSSAFTSALGNDQYVGEPSINIEDWYVGIDGVPVGPITADVLRQHMAQGRVHENSLVWKEGFEDWKAVSAFPELVRLLEDARATNMERAAIAPGTSPGIPQPVVPPSALVAEPETAGAAPPVTTSDFDLESLSPGFKPKKKRRAGTPPAAWIAVIMAVLFGVTIGVVFFSTKERQEVVKYVEVPASAEGNLSGDEPEERAPAVIDEAKVSGESKRPSTTAAAVKKEAEPAKENGKSGGLLTGLTGLKTAGPQAGPGEGTSKNSGGGQLDSAAIQRTVANYSAGVRRSCWQPALDTRSKDAPSSARVNVTINVAADGSVKGVSSGGDPRGYRGLARCIESRVRSWRFPRSSGSTQVNVPFVFAAQ